MKNSCNGSASEYQTMMAWPMIDVVDHIERWVNKLVRDQEQVREMKSKNKRNG